MLSINGLMSLLTLGRRDITTVIIFAVAIGLLSLVVPIAAQGLVTIVSFGTLRQPLFILVIVVFVLLLFSGISRLLQNILVETIQQRIFASIALKVADRLPRIDMATLESNHGSELLNRFFDVMTLQKSIADILINVSAFALQALLGLLLLALYHPALLGFDIVFVAILSLIIIIPYSRGVETSILESEAKYEVVSWLEEMARVPLVFHFQNNATFGFRRADEIVAKYIKARQSHFKVLLQHMIGSYGLQALASTGLFLIGGLLVLNNQMTLGQLVAAEIITTSLGSNASKLSRYLEKIYDLRAAAEKVNTLLLLPSEDASGFLHPLDSHIKPFTLPPSITVTNLVLADNGYHNNTISFSVSAGSSVAISLRDEISMSSLMDAVLGMRVPVSGDVLYNNISLSHYPLSVLRKHISFVRNAECFDGTLLDNITIGSTHVTIEKIMTLLTELSLDQCVSALPGGLKFALSGMCLPFSRAQLMKIVFIREIVSEPLLLAIDEAFDLFPLSDVKNILSVIRKYCSKTTIIVTSRRSDVASLFENRITL